MMYLLERHILARNFFLRPDYVHHVPEAVRLCHAKRFREAYEMVKLIFNSPRSQVFDPTHKKRAATRAWHYKTGE